MTLPPEAFGKALAARAGIRADRRKQEMSRHLNPIMNVVKAEAVPIGARVPGVAAVTSRVGEGQDHRAGMTAIRAGQEAVPERVEDHRRPEAEAAARVKAVVQARAADRKPEHEAAAADRPEPRGGESRRPRRTRRNPILRRPRCQRPKRWTTWRSEPLGSSR